MVALFLKGDTEMMKKFPGCTPEYIDQTLREDPLPWPEHDL